MLQAANTDLFKVAPKVPKLTLVNVKIYLLLYKLSQ